MSKAGICSVPQSIKDNKYLKKEPILVIQSSGHGTSILHKVSEQIHHKVVQLSLAVVNHSLHERVNGRPIVAMSSTKHMETTSNKPILLTKVQNIPHSVDTD
jgi:hypothetical protein